MQIQGTGSVILSGFTNAARLASAASGLPPSDHKILFFGAGSAGIGVAKQLLSFFTLSGLSPEEARSRIYVSNAPSEGYVKLLNKPIRLWIQKALLLPTGKVSKNIRNVRKYVCRFLQTKQPLQSLPAPITMALR